MAKVVDKRCKYKLVIDCEYANGQNTPLIYEFACVVIDSQGRIYEQKQVLLEEIFSNDLFFSSAYAKNKKKKYKEVPCISGALFFNTIHLLVRKYNIKEIVGFNIDADLKALYYTYCFIFKTCYFDNIDRAKQILSLKVFKRKLVYTDLRSIAMQTVGENKGFQSFCLQNNLITPKGYLKSDLATFCAYCNVKYKAHFAIEDCKASAELFQHCKKQHKKIKSIMPFHLMKKVVDK